MRTFLIGYPRVPEVRFRLASRPELELYASETYTFFLDHHLAERLVARDDARRARGLFHVIHEDPDEAMEFLVEADDLALVEEVLASGWAPDLSLCYGNDGPPASFAEVIGALLELLRAAYERGEPVSYVVE